MPSPQKIRFILFFFILGWSCPGYAKEISSPNKLGLGLNFGGIQLDWKRSPQRMHEIRAQKATEKGDLQESESVVLGWRTYRFFRGEKNWSPFYGLEMAYIKAEQKTGTYTATGLAAGSFMGLALKLTNHLTLEFDMGPYLVQLREERTRADHSDVYVVADTSVIYFF